MKLTENSASNLSVIHAKLKTSATGAIAIYSAKFSQTENLQRKKSLLAKLLNTHKFMINEVNGSYIETNDSNALDEISEYSFFVSFITEGNDDGELKDILVLLGKEFELSCIIYIPFEQAAQLIGTTQSDNSNTELNEVLTIDPLKHEKAAEYLDKIKNGSYEIREIEGPGTNFGRWGVSLAASKSWRDL